MTHHPEEHPSDVAWYALTGPQRRLVQAFLGDLERGVDLMDQLDLSPVTVPNVRYLVSTYEVAEEDAKAAVQWFEGSRNRDRMEDKVRDILKGWGEGDR